MKSCTACGGELRETDRFCGQCAAPVLKLVTGKVEEKVVAGTEDAKDGNAGKGVVSADDFVGKGAALGAAVAEHFMPESPMAKTVGVTLGRRIAEALVGSPLIGFGTDQASVALAKSRLEDDARRERKAKRKRKKKETSR